MIRSIIIDDEIHSCDVLKMLISKNCPEIGIVATCQSGESGIRSIMELKPQLVFLDIEMPYMNGFQMLEKIGNVDFEIIFTTSYDQYAITAFRFSALDYLLKPVDKDELVSAVQKVMKKINPPVQQQLDILLQRLNRSGSAVQRVALPTMQGLEFVPIESIIHCSANNNYTEFHLADKRKILVSKTLKDVEDMLTDESFLRVHNSHIVNLNAIVRYMKGEGGYLVMTDGSMVDVSRSRKDLLLQRLQPYKDL